jgi:CRISPR-associated protein (TIGR02710 family)
MRRTLIVTVGGSPQPIITAVRTLQPDRTIFICSDRSKSQVIGQDKPCEIRRDGKVVDRLANLPTVLNLEDRFRAERDLKTIEDPDDTSECYDCGSIVIRDLIAEGGQIMVDYTGGTKTMSLALGMAAMDYGIELYLTTTSRKDLDRVTSGESTEMISTFLINVNRRLEQFLPLLLKQYDYSAAIDQLDSLLYSFPLPKNAKTMIRRLRDICRAFEAWDQFKHEEAWSYLSGHLQHRELQSYGKYLKRIIQSRADIDLDFKTVNGIRGHGYEIIEDLIMNAERRAVQQRYDDAVGRLYRALELLVQIHLLKNHDIKTGNVDINRIPREYRDEYEALRYSHNNEEIKLSFRQSYRLLNLFEDDLLVRLYKKDARRLEDILKVRNNSLFAHGFKPVSGEDYWRLNDVAVSFISGAISVLSAGSREYYPLQFPTRFPIG